MKRAASTRGAQPRQPPDIISVMRVPALALTALLAILALNVAAAYWNIGGYQFAFNVAFAVISVALIALFFMELRRRAALYRLCAMAGLIWLVLFLLLTFGDYTTRIALPF